MSEHFVFEDEHGRQFVPLAELQEAQAEVERLKLQLKIELQEYVERASGLKEYYQDRESKTEEWCETCKSLKNLADAREAKWREYAKLIDNLDIESFATEPSDKDKQRMIQLHSELMEQGSKG